MIPTQEVDEAFALVDAGPVKTEEWVKRAIVMAKHCQSREDVDQAAARILAAEVRRLRAIIHPRPSIPALPDR